MFGAYGWPPDLTDEQILEKLLALNLERAEEEHSKQKTLAGADRYAEHGWGTLQ